MVFVLIRSILCGGYRTGGFSVLDIGDIIVSNKVEFKPWPKIPRDNGNAVIVTEKIDGTNACIVIQDGEIVAVQSRKRFITPEDDNHGFAAWVMDNKDELVKLGDGYHYGEWAGPGIQGNPHAFPEKTLFLFNTLRWGAHNPPPAGCCVVPVLYKGNSENMNIDKLMASLKDYYPIGEPEGVVVYYMATRTMSKTTFKHSKGKWCS